MHNPIPSSIYGYYQVGNQYYLNKTEAVYNASKNKQTAEWHFHEDIFSKLDWSKRPTGTLQDLYLERARQLRDKYDYLILLFSGGMDSWTALDTFLSNNIHIDEIVTRWQRAERKYVDASLNPEQINMGSEFEYAVLPVLEYVQKHFPKIKVTIDDFSDSLEGELTESEFLKSTSWQHQPTSFKYSRSTETELEMVRQNKSIGLVTGAEKIHVAVQDNNFYAFFTDQSNGSDLNPSRKVEFFYWSPDAPHIPVLQAHCIKDYLKEEKQINAEVPSLLEDWRQVYARVCYPRFNIDTFQTYKQFGSLVWQNDWWIQKYNPTYYQSWRYITKQYFAGIDDQYKSKINVPNQQPPDVKYSRGSPYNKTASGVELTVGLYLFNSPFYLIESATNLPNFRR
jgi:hypothetical protein